MSDSLVILSTEVTISVFCNNCGKPLCATLSHDRLGDAIVEIDPCEFCLEEEYGLGYKDGCGAVSFDCSLEQICD